jgi:hypothetical protein
MLNMRLGPGAWPSMRTRGLLLPLVALAAPAAGCGTTEKSGEVGDTLTAKGLEVTVGEVDSTVPMPKSDVTGLTRPSPGSKLFGARVRACSNHGGATGPYDFGVETTSGEHGTLKYPELNYGDGFESLRDGCGSGWVVFEIPAASEAEKVTYGFEDTGSGQPGSDNRVKVRFSWSLPS